VKYLNGTFEDFYALLEEAVTPEFLYDVFLNPATRVTEAMPIMSSPAESQTPEWWGTPFGDYRKNLRKVIIRPTFIECVNEFGRGRSRNPEYYSKNELMNLFFKDYSNWEETFWDSNKCEAYNVGFRIIWFESLDRYYELKMSFTVVLRAGLNNPAVRRPTNFLYFEFPKAQFLEVNAFPGLRGRGEFHRYPSNRISGVRSIPSWHIPADVPYPRKSAWLPVIQNRQSVDVLYEGSNAKEFQFDNPYGFSPGIPYLELDWLPDLLGLNYPQGA